MKILVTRPREDADRTASELEARGHQVMIAPLLEIRFRDGPQISLDGVQAILATSANGVRALARRTVRRDIPVFAVGPQSAAAAKLAGFSDVKSANGDAQALAEAAKAWARPSDGALLHPSGAKTKGGLAETLTASGFVLRREILYDAVALAALPAAVGAALKAGDLEAVLLFSPRSARIFVEVAQKAGLGEACRSVKALCISPAAAAGLPALAFAEVRVAAHPDQAGLFALLD